MSIKEAGIVVLWEEDGTRARIKDDRPDGCAIRNRGGEGVAKLVYEMPRLRFLDMRESRISDNGVGHLSLVLRQTNQLEELYLSSVGLVGLEFIIGVVKGCTRLRTLHLQLVDEPTRQRVAKNITPADFNTSAYVVERKEGEEEEEGEEEPTDGKDLDEEELEKLQQEKLLKLQALFSENDFDSDNEDGRVQPGGRAPGQEKGPSAALCRLLTLFVEAVAKRENLLNVELFGECVPSDYRLDLQRAVEENQFKEQKRSAAREEKAVRTAYDALKDQMEELKVGMEADSGASVDQLLSGGEQVTRLGMRSYVNRRLFAAVGEALFECQRFKSKENEAVASAQGEMAFIAMYIRKQALLLEEENSSKKR